MNDYIVTEIERENGKFIAAALYEDRKLTELSVMPLQEESQVGKIYIGYVESVAKNIGGAFIRVTRDFKCFLPNYKSDFASSQGHMLIRITKDASGVKEAVCSTSIELAGRYCVVSYGKTSLSISKKLGDEERELLKKWINPHDFPGLHILVRTNAVHAQKKDILDEIEMLAAFLSDIRSKAERAKPGTCLYSPEPFYIAMLRDLYVAPDRAYSEIPKIAGELDRYLERSELSRIPGDSNESRERNASEGEGEAADIPASLYNKKAGALTLSQLYNLEHDLDRLSQRVVWLRSGAFLVIEQTEAFVIIDVNTGRCSKGRIPEETYRKINLEAGEEILRQLRLRELSGMILIDFISLTSEDHQTELVQVMKKLARQEHRRTEVYDLTRLGILEMSREKKGKSLEEILRA